MKLRTYFVETWGCQMNVLDSQYLQGLLEARGLRPAANATEADVALLNTCSVREKAVQKVLTRLGELRQARESGGQPRIVGLCGCVAEQEGTTLLARGNVLDFVMGPGRIGELGRTLDAVEAGRRVTATGFQAIRDYDSHLIARGSSARQYVTAIHGCNQHCTFCVVPYTRGHELSRPLEDIVAEVRALGAAGTREITLLGQTVNAYRCPRTGADFGELVSAVCAVGGPWRVQFVTSHPKYFTEKMIETLSRVDGLGTYLHVPFQSGSDAVLRRMHRGYSREGYLELIARLRDAMPALTISSDVIVGFPGETEGDFQQTLDLVREVEFGQLYGFAYSPRPRTPAARYPDQVLRAQSTARLQRLFELQGAIQLKLNQGLIGRQVEVLVDGPAKRGESMWQGRGDDNRVVNFPAWAGVKEGDVVIMTITGATAHALHGERLFLPTPSSPASA
ncbi:MAG: tRNA (N6-isopentenyl adenosine(37)-C2)-methylthiotransferase MiaB [Acidobacteriota bacterium]